MKNKRLKKFFLTFTNILSVIVFILFSIGTIYLYIIINNTPSLNVEYIIKEKSSKIYDQNNQLIKQLTNEDYEDVTYEELPDVFINALLSCEDVRFFLHNGIDLPRLLAAIKNNVTTLSFKEGASTLTQQLIKNMVLTNKKSIERKIQEAYLALNIEKLYTKKDILEFYCNYICFDGMNHGIQTACYKYLNKSVSELTLPEAALMVGIANLPTAYNPFLHPEAANNRKNVVLSLMYQHKYINDSSYSAAKEITVEDMIYHNNSKNDSTYPYQSYLDVVYQQIIEKTSLDPYTTPMEIYTYMDSSLQNEIDKMQENKSSYLYFDNDLQQMAACVLQNNTGQIKAIFGGRNYNGQKLYNRAVNMKNQPASTIKIILDYALAFEYLPWSNKQTLLDVPTTYPNTSITINNVDLNYLGEISIAEAIGYSRNTTAVTTLQEVIKKVGVSTVTNYLKDLNLLDVEEQYFNYSYALGGFNYGVTPLNLAASYAMIANNGEYIEPLTIKKIKLLDGSNIEYNFTPNKKQLLDERTCFLLTDVLKQVMEANYWSIKDVKPQNVNVVAKTGTSNFAKTTQNEYNIPQNASKDKWIAGYSVDYTIVAWTGFDSLIKDKKTYFLKNDNSANVIKNFFKRIIDITANKNLDFKMPKKLSEANIVKGSNNILANQKIEDKYIDKALFKVEDLPTSYFEEPIITNEVIFDSFVLNNNINFIFKDETKEKKYKKIYQIDEIMGGKNIRIDIFLNNIYQESIMTTDLIYSYPLKKGNYRFEIYYQYQNSYLTGPKNFLTIYL